MQTPFCIPSSSAHWDAFLGYWDASNIIFFMVGMHDYFNNICIPVVSAPWDAKQYHWDAASGHPSAMPCLCTIPVQYVNYIIPSLSLPLCLSLSLSPSLSLFLFFFFFETPTLAAFRQPTTNNQQPTTNNQQPTNRRRLTAKWQ